MNSSLLVRQIIPLLAHAGHEWYSALLFRFSRTRPSDSRRQHPHVHFKGCQCMVRPLRRRTFIFASAVAAAFTFGLLIHTLPSKKNHCWPMWLLKAWLKAKWTQLRLWPERLRIWTRHKLKHTWFGKAYAKGSKKWWKEKIKRKERRNRKRKAAQRRRQKWAKRGRKGFAKGRGLFQQGPIKKKRADDRSMHTGEVFKGQRKGSKKSRKGRRAGSKK